MVARINLSIFLVALVIAAILLAGCQAAAPGIPSHEVITPAENASPAPTTAWQALITQIPYPYQAPLPPEQVTPLDGLYARTDPDPPQWWSCLRCADYRPAGGDWRLNFSHGVMRILYLVNGWRSLASYTVSGDRLFIFNDPYCPDETGEYSWTLEERQLVLKAINDTCAFGLRAANLEKMAWESCTVRPDGELGRGCTDVAEQPATVVAEGTGLRIAIQPGDARKFDPPPDVLADANFDDRPQPYGIELTASESSIPYGLHRILWKDGDYLEARTERPFEAIGVQFTGSELIGWARVLFDGVEVWRGDTNRLGSFAGQYGGYIEISGFEPGEHTLRVERLDLDSRPVRVAFFGFR